MKHLYSLIFLIFILPAGAQVKYEFGPEAIPEKDLRLNEILGGNDTHFFTHKISTEGKGVTHFIQKFDRKTLLSFGLKELILEEGDFKTEIVRLLYSDNKLLAVVVKNIKKSKQVSCVIQCYDINTLVKIGETELSSFEMESYFTPQVAIKVNGNNTRTAIQISAASINPKEIFTDYVLYDNIKNIKLWSKKNIENDKKHEGLIRDEKISNGIASSSLASFEIDDNDNMHCVSTVESEMSTKKDKADNLNYTVIKANGAGVKSLLLSCDFSCSLIEYKTTVLANNQTAITGIYREINSDKKFDQLTLGIFNFMIDNNAFKLISKKFSALGQYYPNGDVVNNTKKLIRGFTMDKVLPYGNSVVLMGHKERSILVSSQSGTAQYSHLFYFDIFLVKINVNSEIEFYRELPFASTISSGFGPNYITKQYIEVIKNDNLYVFHNEHPETTTIINNEDKITDLTAVNDGAKHFICNKINLKNASNQRTLIEVPPKNKFMPVLEAKYALARRPGAEIFDIKTNYVYIPIGWGSRMERFLKISLD